MVSNTWPVPHTATAYYLHKDGSLNTAAPKDQDASLSYIYDPNDPAPSIGGSWGLEGHNGPFDQRPLLDAPSVVRPSGDANVPSAKGRPTTISGFARKDVLRFVSAPLAEPVGITGKVWVDLRISSDATDTEFVAKLVDIYPDGYEALVRESAMLARYHQGLDKPAPLEKGKVYGIKMDMWSTALVFNKGHRIALYVSSSSAPAYEVHPNTYEQVKSMGEAKVAHNMLHLSADAPSKLILPVVAKETYINVGGSGDGRKLETRTAT
jgi:predicted acyl esterase